MDNQNVDFAYPGKIFADAHACVICVYNLTSALYQESTINNTHCTVDHFLKKLVFPKTAQSTLLKKRQTMFFHANTIKKGQKMPNYDVHAKHHFFMPNHF